MLRSLAFGCALSLLFIASPVAADNIPDLPDVPRIDAPALCAAYAHGGSEAEEPSAQVTHTDPVESDYMLAQAAVETPPAEPEDGQSWTVFVNATACLG